MKKFILPIVVFLCGFVVMVLEIVGSRVVAPYLGTSIIVWTSLIGVILASLSFGYWWGGRIADQNPNTERLSKIIFAAGVCIVLGAVYKTPILTSIENNISNIYVAAVAAALFLFAFPSILLGAVAPYAARLSVASVQTTGTTVGNLYALSTVGSIVGTFLTGFVLLAFVGSTTILFLLALILGVCSLVLFFTKDFRIPTLVVIAIISVVSWAGHQGVFLWGPHIVDVDTAYSHVQIVDGLDLGGTRPFRYLMTNPGETQSGMFIDKPTELAFAYSRFYRVAAHFNPNIHAALMFGGAGYSYPKDFLQQNPSSTMTVIEIDPAMTKLAEKYFALPSDPRLTTVHADARVFLNKKSIKYDAIYGDAFSSWHAIPFQLTTQEAAQKIYASLSDNGVYIANLISSVGGEKGKFLHAEYATFKSVFPQVYIFPLVHATDESRVQNIMLVAIKSEVPVSFTSTNPELQGYLNKRLTSTLSESALVFTDDFAPVESYIAALQH